MIVVQEVTEWTTDTPNHIYILSDDKSKLIGYIQQPSLTHKIFKTPIQFDPRGRKFKLLRKVVK